MMNTFIGGEVFFAKKIGESDGLKFVACQPEFHDDIWANLVMQSDINRFGSIGPFRLKREEYVIELMR